MSLQPGEPPPGPGPEAAADAAREADDPEALQVDLDGDERSGELLDDVAPEIEETDKIDRARASRRD